MKLLPPDRTAKGPRDVPSPEAPGERATGCGAAVPRERTPPGGGSLGDEANSPTGELLLTPAFGHGSLLGQQTATEARAPSGDDPELPLAISVTASPVPVAPAAIDRQGQATIMARATRVTGRKEVDGAREEPVSPRAIAECIQSIPDVDEAPRA